MLGLGFRHLRLVFCVHWDSSFVLQGLGVSGMQVEDLMVDASPVT